MKKFWQTSHQLPLGSLREFEGPLKRAEINDTQIRAESDDVL